MTAALHGVLASRGAAEIIQAALARLGTVVLDLLVLLDRAWSGGSAEVANAEASGASGLVTPAVLMAGGLATLAVLFTLMLLREPSSTHRTERAKPAGAAPGGHTPPPAAGQRSAPPTEAGDLHQARRAEPEHLPFAYVEQVDELGEEEAEITLSLSSAGALSSSVSEHPNRSQARNGTRVPKGTASSSRGRSVRHPGHREQLDRGRRAGARFSGSSVHELLEHITETGLGEPRVLQQVPHLIRLRLVHCRGCTSGAPGQDHAVNGCPFEEGFLEAAFGHLHEGDIVVREIACTQRGDPGCDFEIWV